MKRIIGMMLCVVMVLATIAGCAPAAAPVADPTPTPAAATPTPAPATPAPAAPQAAEAKFTPGTYTAEVVAMHGPLAVEVTLSESAITNVVVTSNVETPGVGEVAVNEIPAAIVANQSLDVDVVSGVTITSTAIKSAVEDCLEQAGGSAADLPAYTAPVEEDYELSADVVIVGGGGAGMAAAITALDEGASVIVVEKMGFLGGNSIVAGGIYNAPDPSKQDQAVFAGDLDSMVQAIIDEAPVSALHAEYQEIVRQEFEEYKTSGKTLFDSPTFFALQTWNGGDKVAHLDMLKIMCENALDGLKWMESMGMEFEPQINLASGSLYPRTHNAVMPNGTGYFKAFTENLDGREGYTQIMNTNVDSLIVENGRVVGANATGPDGNAVTLRANKGVILATGGFAGNVELRQEYCEGEKWPDLGPQVPTSNMPGVRGDGIFMAQDAGAKLVNMEQIQLLHCCNPITGATYDITIADCFINQEGKRFVREDGRRDEMSKAIIAQTGGIMYSVFSADYAPDPVAATALGGMSLQYMLDNNIAGYVSANTLEELAEKINVPADALVQTVEEFNSYVDGEATDPLGRVAFQGKKIETGPFYAYPRSPALHHTMGGVLIDDQCRALGDTNDPVPGLYCAGEITGVIHGGNRIGGNAIVDFIVFGRIAGKSAANNDPIPGGTTYTGSATGMGGEFSVNVTIDENGVITSVHANKNLETIGVGTVALSQLSAAIVETQNLDVDSVTGATVSSAALKSAVTKAIESAGLDVSAYKKGAPAPVTAPIEKTADVIIVGGGGAGLAAAVAATDLGASVIVMEKMGFVGGNTSVCGGIYNSYDPAGQAGIAMTDGVRALIDEALAEEPVSDLHAEVMATIQQQYDEYNANGSVGLFDSPEWHALQTWNGGDKIADLEILLTMGANAPSGLEWVQSMGMEFLPSIMQGAGSLYQRTHTAKEPLGSGFINAYLRTLDKRTNLCEIITDAKAEELILDGDKVVGVTGVTTDGAPVTLHANKSVVLATGGFGGSVEMRQQYNTSGKWPDLGASVPTTNMAGITGEGILMAQAAGANLVNMEQIQLLQMGHPQLGAITGLNFENSVATYVFINKEGNRFVREDGRRDDICIAILEQPDGLMYLVNNVLAIPDPNVTTTKEGMTIAEEEAVGWIYSGATLDELAEKIGVPADNLKATMDAFNASVDSQSDEFGRALFTEKLVDGPWYALPRVPSVHHTMGGVQINTECQALKPDGSVVPGLFCAGEITGVVHGGNRLGGNAVVDTVVFGRIAGTSAAQ